jgi:hypothetical protein
MNAARDCTVRQINHSPDGMRSCYLTRSNAVGLKDNLSECTRRWAAHRCNRELILQRAETIAHALNTLDQLVEVCDRFLMRSRPIPHNFGGSIR